MLRILISLLALFISTLCCSQNAPSDSLLSPAQKATADSVRMANLEASMTYPFIYGGKFSGVIPIKNPVIVPDPNLTYKLLFELTIFNNLKQRQDINHGLTEICRIINLHKASGIPEKNLELVILVHAPGLFNFYQNDYFQKKYKLDNPNIELIKALSKKGVTFIGCGQAMSYLNMKEEEMVPEIKLSLTAQTVLSSYQLKGYVLYAIKEDKF